MFSRSGHVCEGCFANPIRNYSDDIFLSIIKKNKCPFVKKNRRNYINQRKLGKKKKVTRLLIIDKLC